MRTFEPTTRTTVRRDDRGVYDREEVDAILDEALLCHVGFDVDGQPFVMPTIHARIGDTVYLHGSPATRMMRALKAGAPVCLTATLLDGLVMARSAFHHSMNYRCAVVLGVARSVTDDEEKLAALDAVVEHVARGRSAEARPPSDKELRGTAVLALDLDECSAKIRTGPPVDEPEDHALDVWAGVLPLRVAAGEPEADPELREGIAVSPSVAGWSRPERF